MSAFIVFFKKRINMLTCWRAAAYFLPTVKLLIKQTQSTINFNVKPHLFPPDKANTFFFWGKKYISKCKMFHIHLQIVFSLLDYY